MGCASASKKKYKYYADNFGDKSRNTVSGASKTVEKKQSNENRTPL